MKICNSQDGNNNAYCQDNPTGWVNWSNEQSRRENIRFLTRLINSGMSILLFPVQSRLNSAITGLLGILICPTTARMPEGPRKCDATKLCVGVMYCGDYNKVNKDYVYVAYNFTGPRKQANYS